MSYCFFAIRLHSSVQAYVLNINYVKMLRFLRLFQDGLRSGVAVRDDEHHGTPSLQSRSYDPQ